MARTVEHERHHVAGAHLVVALHGAVVDVYEAGIGRLLYAVARGVLQLLTHELVYPYGLLPGVGLEAEVLVQLLVIVLYLLYVVVVFSHWLMQ